MGSLSRFPLADLLVAVAAFILVLRYRQLGNVELSRLVMLIFIGLVILQAALMVIQYQRWQADPLMRLTLPPHTNITYFLRYGYFAFLRPVVWRFLGAIIVLLAMLVAHNFFRRSLFLPDEFRLVPVLSLLPTFPLGLMLLPLGLLVGFGFRFGHSSAWHEKQPLKDFWLPLTFSLVFVALIFKQTPWFYRFQP